jgi:hypothetical protein
MIPVVLLLAMPVGADPARLVVAPLPHEVRPDLAPDLAELQLAGIEPTPEGVRKYLEALRLSPGQDVRVRALLADLSHPDFQVRERATQRLIAFPYLPRAMLCAAANRDPETAQRILRVMREARHAAYERLTYPVLRVVAERPVRGLAPLLLEFVPQWQEYYLAEVAVRGVTASAVPADRPLLRRAIASDRPGPVRVAATSALAAISGRAAEADLEPLLTDSDLRVALAAATALLDQGSRKPLPALVRLLDADSDEIRLSTAEILRAVTGRSEENVMDLDPMRRALAVAGWRAWVEREGETAPLQLPARPKAIWRGRVVICGFDRKVVREVDLATGKMTLEIPGYTYPWGCHATPNGHRLAVDYMTKEIVEYDAVGKECWRKAVTGRPTGVERLPNGRTLVPLPEEGRVVEIDLAGRVVWEIKAMGRPTTALRLPDGNTLITLQDSQKVVEMDRNGKELWHIGGVGRAHTVQRLPNGNTLVCEFGGTVSEYNRSGKVVWSKVGLINPAQAQRLPNGNTLISSAQGLFEYDRAGSIVQKLDSSRCRFFAY